MRPGQHGIKCDMCLSLQHRTYDTGMNGDLDDNCDGLAALLHPTQVIFEIPQPVENAFVDDISEASVHMEEEITYELVKK